MARLHCWIPNSIDSIEFFETHRMVQQDIQDEINAKQNAGKNFKSAFGR